LTKSEMAVAVRRYARRHGYYAGTVRSMTVLRLAAVREFLNIGKLFGRG
jgi:hypothetical protein